MSKFNEPRLLRKVHCDMTQDFVLILPKTWFKIFYSFIERIHRIGLVSIIHRGPYLGFNRLLFNILPHHLSHYRNF